MSIAFIPKPEHAEDAADNRIWCRNHRGKTYSHSQAMALICKFHGHAAPGLAIGTQMVSLAMDRLPPGILFDALCETASCLPDAVQMLTPCTIGNGWLRVENLGRYAVTLYDKSTGDGIRVYLDPAKLKVWPEFYDWFFKRKAKKEQNFDLLMEEIRLAGQGVLTARAVKIKPSYLIRHSKGKIATCNLCQEAYPAAQGSICSGCQGAAPYEVDSVDRPAGVTAENQKLPKI